MKYDVCILSRDELYAQWLLLLFAERGYTVTVSDNPLCAPSSALYLADLDSSGEVKRENAKVIYFSSSKDLISRYGGLLRPFSPKELFLALTCDGASAKGDDGQTIQDGRVISFGGRYIRLTEREFELYSLLREANGASVPRSEICRRIWNCDDTESLNIYIHYLRKKLEANGTKVIKSHRGKGYSLITRGN